MTVTKYEGPSTDRVKLGDAEIDKLRSQVPDDPIPLPESHAACECCGVAVPAGGGWALCPSCAAIRTAAERYAEGHRALAARVGPVILAERVESVLLGLAIIGQPPPATDLGLLLPRLHPAAHQVRFRQPYRMTEGLCSPHPFAHVTLTERAELRAAYAAYLADRLSLSAPPVTIRCPSGGCAMCGLSSVDRSALEVARRGGPKATSSAVWRPVMTTRTALGRPGPDRVAGHLCPACDHAVEESGHAIGQSAMSRSIRSHLLTHGEDRARRWDASREDDFPVRLVGWAVTGAPPSSEPWSHASKLLRAF